MREAVKYENQISQGLIEQEAEKTQSFIHEFLFYITDIIERNSEHLINPKPKVELHYRRYTWCQGRET